MLEYIKSVKFSHSFDLLYLSKKHQANETGKMLQLMGITNVDKKNWKSSQLLFLYQVLLLQEEGKNKINIEKIWNWSLYFP